ncbi:MAG: riboflavin synthase [Candidatus Omnitrophica bacterium]|nr:riboflavin synthase [Candidatus Omnitrophota bacterium]
MFTGIIEELGKVKKIYRQGMATKLVLEAELVSRDVAIGDSIAVDGACLTVVKKFGNQLEFDVLPETARISTLGALKVNDRVNLERSLKVGDRLSGHFVQGHIDCIGVIRKKGFSNGNLDIVIAVPPAFLKYCLLKGAIAVDGVSLTIAKIFSSSFSVYIIPHTLTHTTLQSKSSSDRVNLEFDILLKRPVQ